MKRKGKKFSLTKTYSVVSLLGIILVGVISSTAHRNAGVDSLLKIQNEANVDLARAFSNSIWQKYVDFFERAYQIPTDKLTEQPELSDLKADLERQMRGVRVVKIKVYDRSGTTVFSTEASQIGENKATNPGFMAAMQGEVTNEITFRDKFNAFDMVIEDRDLLASYLPIRFGPDQEVVAVFELYSDITTLLEEISATEYQTVAMGSGMLLVLYAFLLIFIRRADNQLKAHELQEQASHKKHIEYLANNDQLTGLANRDSLIRILDAQIIRAQESDERLVFILTDIEQFKLINDNLGQTSADQLLVEFASRIEQTLGPDTTLGRVGGDQFMGVIRQKSDRVLDSLVSRLINALTEPYHIDEHSVNPGVSVGIATYPEGVTDGRSALKNAEAAMKSAKQLGRNRFAFFNTSLNELAIRRFELESALIQAVEQRQFEVFYQPRVSASGEVVSAEALLRWRRDGQIVSPVLFIEALETTELIVPVGTWVLHQATRDCQRWRKNGADRMRVSVNLSLRQLQQKYQFMETVRLALLESGLDAEALELELTESLMADDSELTLMMLKAIRGMGIHLSIDDFGTGYSSLSYLRNYPFDCVKIDQSFVKESATSEAQQKLTRSIILMANALNLKTVAEGVETLDLKEGLLKMGADELQGYYFAKPMPADQFEAWLANYSASNYGF